MTQCQTGSGNPASAAEGVVKHEAEGKIYNYQVDLWDVFPQLLHVEI